MCGGDVSRCHTSKKEYHECTDTMAQMKNKINETKNVHTMYSVICGHDKSAPYSGCTWCKRWVHEDKYHIFVE